MIVEQSYEVIFHHITQECFGPAIYDDQNLLRCLLKALPLMYDEIMRRQYGDIKIGIVAEVAFKILGENINRLKKEDERRLCFEVAFIMLFNFHRRSHHFHLMYNSVETFLVHYPTFRGLDETELSTLLTYRNVMKVAQILIPPKNHKNHLLDLTTRIVEGKNQKYITGSGQTVATARRVLIYETEGNIKPIPRPPRICKNKFDGASSSDPEIPPKRQFLDDSHSPSFEKQNVKGNKPTISDDLLKMSHVIPILPTSCSLRSNFSELSEVKDVIEDDDHNPLRLLSDVSQNLELSLRMPSECSNTSVVWNKDAFLQRAFSSGEISLILNTFSPNTPHVSSDLYLRLNEENSKEREGL
jgi:hypothetical protein